MSGQSGRLGISIAGGKGSLPYKDHDEVSPGAAELKIIKFLAIAIIHNLFCISVKIVWKSTLYCQYIKYE